MIPHTLQLKNFLSYGSTLETVDFSTHALICLSGKNGHGKSALLDAMTWALWGQARKVSGTAKADQGLLRLGQTQMLVIFDFDCGNRRYRIRREYMETYGKPITSLEFGMIDTTTDTFIPLTDKTIRTTQEKIELTLRLDFDSFCNSAFLRQGNSNEFSKKSPKDRKQILATILGLDQYEVIRKRALEKIKDAWAHKNVLATLQTKRETELATQDNLTQEIAVLDCEMNTIQQQETQWQKELTALTHEKIILDEKQKQHTMLAFQAQQLQETQQLLTTQLKDIVTQWRTINKKKESLHNNTKLEQEKRKINNAIADSQKLFQRNLEYKETLLHLTQELNAIEQAYKNEQTKKNQLLLLELERLDADQKNSTKIVAGLQEQMTRYHKELIDNNTQISALVTDTATPTITHHIITQQETHLEKRKAAYQHFVSLGNWINAELNNLTQKKKLVHKDDPSCPLCEQNLSASRRRFLKANFDKNESLLVHRLRRLKRIIPALKELLLEHHATLLKNKEYMQRATATQLKKEELTRYAEKIKTDLADITATLATQQIDIEARARVLEAQKKALHDATQRNELATHQHYQQLIRQKTVQEKELAEHPYNADDYKKLQERLTIIEHQLTDYESLTKEIAHQETRKQEVGKLCGQLKQLKQNSSTLQKKITALGDLTVHCNTIAEKEKNLDQSRATIKNSKELLLHAKGSKENQQKHLAAIKNEYEQEQKNIITLDIIIDDYQAIATATGKDGIQALLIEDAIPEIEQEANYLLSRLTNNQAHIFIESLRDLKKGGTKETLDIKISDQAGIRPYELFSGGEAFRIDFALRIAISKLLARRSGTPLQTLIIDEGFGSQDEEGLSHIMDALHKIQDIFSKIIIVSHLPAMKDQFPVQFFVEKRVQGSVVTIIEQG
jgi:DNA repair protein SbcC/Rad50